MKLRILGLALLVMAAGFVTAPNALAAAPINDNVANAATAELVQREYSKPFTNVDATVEPGESDRVCGDVSVGSTVWWKFDAPSEIGTYTFSTAGSNFDTVLAVYATIGGQRLPDPVAGGCNDDIDGDTRASRVDALELAASTYYVQVGGFGPPPFSDEGTGTLTITHDPPPSGTIQGVVTELVSGRALSGFCVYGGTRHMATTSQTGSYSFGWAPGDVVVRVNSCGAGTHEEESTEVTVTNGDTFVRNFALRKFPAPPANDQRAQAIKITQITQIPAEAKVNTERATLDGVNTTGDCWRTASSGFYDECTTTLGSANGVTESAKVEPTPADGCLTDEHQSTAWYRYQPKSDTDITVSTTIDDDSPTTFTPFVAVYAEDPDTGQLTGVACASDADGDGAVSIDSVELSGLTNYFFQVGADAKNPAGGPLTVSFALA